MPFVSIQVAEGVDAREAWTRCGKPKGQAGIRNIRKQGHKLRKLAAVAPKLRSAAAPPKPLGPGKGKSAKGYRLKPAQLKIEQGLQQHAKQQWDKIYAAGTAAWASRVAVGQTGKGHESADSFAATLEVPAGSKRITGGMLKKAVQDGRAGKAPKKRGRSPALPAELIAALAGYAMLKQVGGDEKKPRAIMGAALAAVKGTPFESKLVKPSQRRHLLSKVRRAEGIHSGPSQCVDDRRWQWLTSGNLTRWFACYFEILFERGFIDSEPDSVWEVVTILPARAARMGNADESHQKLSNEGEQRGPRANTYHNPKLGRAGKRKVECQKHASIMAWVAYAGECGGLHLMLASDSESLKKGAAEDAPAARINPEWTFGVPRVNGTWGNTHEIVMEPSFILNEKGGMQGSGLEQWVENQIIPAYPNMAYDWKFDEAGNVLEGPVFIQLDAGPDRLTDCSLAWRQRMWTAGLILWPGLPNGTAGNQVCDDLFGVYKTGCDKIAEDIVSERIAAADLDSSVTVKLDFCDLGRIINGSHGDPDEERPFCNAFTPEKIISSVRKLGLNPVSLEQAVSHRRVRDDSEGGTRTTAISKVRARQASDVKSVQALGLNSSVLTVPPPKPKKKSLVAPPSTAEEQYAMLKENSSVGTMWFAVGSKAFNAPMVTEPAVARLEERKVEEQRKQVKAAGSWSELQAAALELEGKCEHEGIEYSDLSAAEVKQLVTYVFRARKEKGASAVSAPKAAAVAFLTALPAGEMQHLLLCTEPGVAGARLLTAAATTEMAEPEQEPLALTFTAA